MKKFVLLLLLITAVFHNSKTYAIDPVTIAVLTPVAIKGAEVAAPYVARGLASGTAHLVQMGGHVMEVFLIPWGVGQTLALEPATGLGNVVQGCCAPFKLAWDVITLPAAFLGLGLE